MGMRLGMIGLMVTLLFSLFSCRKQMAVPAGFEQDVKDIRSKYAPDPRTKIFNITYSREDNHWRIDAETTEPDAKRALDTVISKYFKVDEIRTDIHLLPEADLQDSVWGLLTISVGNVKKMPDHAAELIDQIVMGNEVKILKKHKGWYLIQAVYDYLGWITQGSLYRTNRQGIDNWLRLHLVQLDINYTQVYTEASSDSQVVCDAVLGCIFAQTGKQGSWLRVKLPDGRQGYVEAKYFKLFQKLNNDRPLSRGKIVARALKMLGIPYLWGGNSIKGFDCSGFSGTVYASEGYRLPRDANMQVLVGEKVIPDSAYRNILPGDLLFFGTKDKISHVAISLGGYEFIHSASPSYVRLNSLDGKNKLYDEFDKKRLKVIKRIIKE
jgi:SH3-like domain-containing protein